MNDEIYGTPIVWPKEDEMKLYAGVISATKHGSADCAPIAFTARDEKEATGIADAKCKQYYPNHRSHKTSVLEVPQSMIDEGELIVGRTLVAA